MGGDSLSRLRVVGAFLGAPRTASWLALGVTLFGLFLRVEHALTFDGPARGSDYAVYVDGIRWMQEHRRSFDFDPTASLNVRYQPPLWYASGAAILAVTQSERAIASLSVIGWLVRQLLLARMLPGPGHAWSRLVALSLHAVLPLGVLMDGKVNPEGLHATLFMVAAYFLFRAERDLATSGTIPLRTALAFGLASGLGILTKATSTVLLLGAGVCLPLRASELFRSSGWLATWRGLIRPAALAAAVCVGLTAWWWLPNYQRFGHPFPHAWDVQPDEAQQAVAAVPLHQRRPVEWFLPFETTYLETPILTNATEPTPNFWAATIAGTWSDWYNRGFCRLPGKKKTLAVWGAEDAAAPETWAVTERCMRRFSRTTKLGAALSAGAILALAVCALRSVTSRGKRGTLVLPVLATLVLLFVMLFAVVHPADYAAVLKPAYMLAAATPITACLGIALAEAEVSARRVTLLHVATLALITAVGAILTVMRFGH